ncbi:MAG: ATP-grasp domain-containing protein, partial [Myxococcales bacterium]|nr:ATP-grasp domain-containing protein [Myxococcales bacterium]
LAEDGRLPGLLDWLGLPYTGEDCRTSAITFDKAVSRALAERAGLPMPAGVIWPSDGAATRRLDELPFGLPVVVKPVAEGSSVGVSLVREPGEWAPALAAAATGGEVTVEAYVAGTELSVGVVRGKALGTAEIVPKRAFYDYEAKYGNAGTEYFVPARIEPAVAAEVEALAERAVAAFGCRGAVRVDFLLGADGPVFLEVNTLPGMTPSSLLPKIAAGAGLPFDALIDGILDDARCGREVSHGA